MNTGYIITFGKKAITIQTKEKIQYIANFEDYSEGILEMLSHNFYSNLIMFDIDKSRFSGETKYGKRYYAINVKFYELII